MIINRKNNILNKLFLIVSIFYLLTFSTSAKAIESCNSEIFTKSFIVFDAVQICATQNVSDDKLSYAVNSIAEWLDNDNDGIADEASVIQSLQHNQATLIISGEFGELDDAMENIDNKIFQDLYASEINPSHDRDATGEETHHLIINAGWAYAHSDKFNWYDSKMFKVYKYAEDNYFYYYDDRTCDSYCKSIEFHYLGVASYLGSKQDLFSDEMKLKNREILINKLPEFIKLIESPEYNYPKYKWPTGQYKYRNNIKPIYK